MFKSQIPISTDSAVSEGAVTFYMPCILSLIIETPALVKSNPSHSICFCLQICAFPFLLTCLRFQSCEIHPAHFVGYAF